MFLNGYHDGAVEVSHSTPFANVGTIFDVTEGQCHKEDMSVRYKHEFVSCFFFVFVYHEGLAPYSQDNLFVSVA